MAVILTVDDSPTIRKIIVATLESVGHEVHEAMEGSMALESAKTKRYDLVLIDYYLPDTNGMELVKSIRALADYQEVPLVILTTEGSDIAKQDKESPVTAWMMKPFDPDELVNTVNKLLESGHAN